MIQTVIIAEDTPSKLTMRLNDWLKGWPDDKIVDIKYCVDIVGFMDKEQIYCFSALIIYQE